MAYSYATIPARIAGTGSYLPEKVIHNHEIPGLENSNGGIQRLLGAVERRAAAPEEVCSDMIAAAARRVLEAAERMPSDLDRIIVSATPGDYFEPCTAAVVQHKIGAVCPAIDVSMSCVGWVAGLDFALRCLATGDERILLMAGTIVSKGNGFYNPMHRAIFGDGAGGVLLEKAAPGQFLAGGLWTAGEHHEVIAMPHATSIYSDKVPPEYEGSFYMGERRAITAVLHNGLGGVIDEVFEMAGVSKDDVDVAFIHQPSRPLFEAAVKASGIPRSKIIEDYERYGNTISAELPISLDESVRSGRVKRGDLVLKVTFGAGFSCGIVIYRY